jgi:hypothetical protein
MKEFMDAWSKCVTLVYEFEIEDRYAYLMHKKEFYETAERKREVVVTWAHGVRDGK